MRVPRQGRFWWIAYALCCLVYMVWMVRLGQHDLGMVHSQYQQAGARLQPEHIRKKALQELVDQCRQDARVRGGPGSTGNAAIATAEDPCRSWPPAVLERQQHSVQERLAREKSRAQRKLVLFYGAFVIVFLLLPPLILFLPLSAVIWVIKRIRLAR